MSAENTENGQNPQFTVQVVDNGYIMVTSVPDSGKKVGISETYVFRGLSDLQVHIEEWVYQCRLPDDTKKVDMA